MLCQSCGWNAPNVTDLSFCPSCGEDRFLRDLDFHVGDADDAIDVVRGILSFPQLI